MTRCVAPKDDASRAVGRVMTYRDAAEAAQAQRDALRRELTDLDHQIADGARRDEQRRALQRALHEAERELDRERAKVSLPLLAQVRVARPCHARWEDMRGDDHARHCRACDKTVFDLSSLTRDEAEALLQRHIGAPMCVRFYRRADGTVMTSDCSVGVARSRQRSIAIAAGLTAFAGLGVLGAGAAVAAAVYAVALQDETPEGPVLMGALPFDEEVQGEMVYVPPPEPSVDPTAPPHVAPPHVAPPHVAPPEAER